MWLLMQELATMEFCRIALSSSPGSLLAYTTWLVGGNTGATLTPYCTVWCSLSFYSQVRGGGGDIPQVGFLSNHASYIYTLW